MKTGKTKTLGKGLVLNQFLRMKVKIRNKNKSKSVRGKKKKFLNHEELCVALVTEFDSPKRG